MRPLRPCAVGPASIVPPRWSPTWPTTDSSGWCWPASRVAVRDRHGAERWSPWGRPESPRSLVSRAAKAAVERQRPEEQLEALVRTPSSSSFPSGHTLAAFCTAFVLPETSTGTVACVSFATAVAASRVHLRAHHATDVLGGAAIGSMLGLGLRPVVRLVTPGANRARASRRARRSGRGMGSQEFRL